MTHVTRPALTDLPLARASVARAAELRDGPRVLTDALADRRTRVLAVRDGGLLLDGDGAVRWLDPAGARALLAAGAAVGEAGAATDVRSAGAPGDVPTGDAEPHDVWLLLGAEDDGARVLAVRLPDEHPLPVRGEPADVLVHLPDGPVTRGGWHSLRAVGAGLDAHDAGLATAAVALDAWHDRHPRCPRCGAPTRVAQAGWSRVCEADGSEHYPRTDPAVIMAVVDDDDRLLLGHAAAWPAGRWSTLAGFVEAGESAEQAVRREVAEETGVEVGDVEYAGSQPWPFPGSLMLGFRARATSTRVQVDGVEMAEARWFTREGLVAAVASGEVLLPGGASIARALVEQWFGRPIAD
ncbi:NAD(+) diphosphatase [Cellulomonas sp. zg-Y908]|uniref:NAD(+) diphosphatase n=1 Tax=Cellulomonas wangsupingiae TaxID=2968085 RepID=A0ABY5K534_9CELL|nr:NAD(+) diphosphatase [Cellulomonas wangsupingiae]MCC2335796.1 NAD(+) diphosphatase [Cellulomonas wangsupingiae]UUI64026.1 NAD(+) diphosphatase [Cellulomonas wangsupingiae]